MRVIEPPIQPSAWSQYIAPVIESVPDGFQTIKQIAVETNRSFSHTGAIVRGLVERGLADVIVVRTPGMKYPTPHYRLKSYGQTQSSKKHRSHR